MEPNGRLDRLIERVTRVEEQVKNSALDSRDCLGAVKELREQLDQRSEARHRERKEDRRWMVGTILAATTLVIGAMAIIIPLVTG